MVFSRKQLRYYYWIVIEFTKKNARLLLLSFFLSVIFIISLVSLSPFLVNVTTTKKIVVGMPGITDVSNVPTSILSKVSNGLLFVNEKGEIVPILAEKWELINNGTEYRFHLRKDLYWNNGEKFTAKDVNYNFKDIEKIVVNDYELIYKLKKRLPVFPTYLTQPIIKKPFIGVAGVYKVDRSKIKFGNITELYLTPTKSNLPSLVYKFYDNEARMINAYKLGQINEMTITKKSVADTFKTWKNSEIINSTDYSRLLTVFYNMNSEAMKQKERKEVRQAVSMLLARGNFEEHGEKANSPIPPISWAYSPEVNQSRYNEEFVQKILRSGDEKLEVTLNTYEEYLDTATQIQELLSDTNIKLNVKVLTFDKPTTFDMLLAFWKVPADPDQYYYWHSTQTQGNITGYKSEKIDKLLEDGRDTFAIEDRKATYENFQKVIVDEVPAYFMYYPYVYTIKRK